MTKDKRIEEIRETSNNYWCGTPLLSVKEVQDLMNNYNKAKEEIRYLLSKLDEANEKVDKNGCAFAGVGRGDCSHFIGIHDKTDVYGKPEGWCWFCWQDQRIKELEEANEYATRLLKRLTETVTKCNARGDRIKELEAVAELVEIHIENLDKCDRNKIKGLIEALKAAGYLGNK